MEFEVEDTTIKSKYGNFNFYCFSFGDHEEDQIICLTKEWSKDATPLVRIQSACYTAEIFRSLDCDCHEQLEMSLKEINSRGGVFIYMICDGRGAGLLNKIKGLKLGETKGMDTHDAYKFLGLETDPRNYERVNNVLGYFGLKKIKLLTNNPRKIKGVENSGIVVERQPLLIEPTNESISYLRTKKEKMGHLLDQLT